MRTQSGLATLTPAYDMIASIGSAAARRLAPAFPETVDLWEAVTMSASAVAEIAAVPEALVVRWWPGALAWLAAGRRAEVINLYQAAGYADARAVAADADTQVLWRLSRIAAVDIRLRIPPTCERNLMRVA
ncbi:MAG: hypothetical protein V9G19_01620 [Tetrasphaera sp.]